MNELFSRTELLFGADAMERLAHSRVAVFGLGGVGGYAVEALARSGIGALDLIDNDRVSLSNRNRQLYALESTLGQYKVEVASRRVLDINPACVVTRWPVFFLPETRGQFDFTVYDYVVDAVDTVTAKLTLIEAARDARVPLISSMGTGNKRDPSALRLGDLFDTDTDPLARVMRRECRRRGIDRLPVVYSREEPLSPQGDPGEPLPEGRRTIPGSTAFVPAAAGLLLASHVVKELTSGNKKPSL